MDKALDNLSAQELRKDLEQKLHEVIDTWNKTLKNDQPQNLKFNDLSVKHLSNKLNNLNVQKLRKLLQDLEQAELRAKLQLIHFMSEREVANVLQMELRPFLSSWKVSSVSDTTPLSNGRDYLLDLLQSLLEAPDKKLRAKEILMLYMDLEERPHNLTVELKPHLQGLALTDDFLLATLKQLGRPAVRQNLKWFVQENDSAERDMRAIDIMAPHLPDADIHKALILSQTKDYEKFLKSLEVFTSGDVDDLILDFVKLLDEELKSRTVDDIRGPMSLTEHFRLPEQEQLARILSWFDILDSKTDILELLIQQSELLGSATLQEHIRFHQYYSESETAQRASGGSTDIAALRSRLKAELKNITQDESKLKLLQKALEIYPAAFQSWYCNGDGNASKPKERLQDLHAYHFLYAYELGRRADQDSSDFMADHDRYAGALQWMRQLTNQSFFPPTGKRFSTQQQLAVIEKFEQSQNAASNRLKDIKKAFGN